MWSTKAGPHDERYLYCLKKRALGGKPSQLKRTAAGTSTKRRRGRLLQNDKGERSVVAESDTMVQTKAYSTSQRGESTSAQRGGVLRKRTVTRKA